MPWAIELDNRRGYQKVEFLCRQVGLTISDLGTILGLEKTIVEATMVEGIVPDVPDREEIDGRFYSLLILFDYLLNLSGKQDGELFRLWQDADHSLTHYASVIVKPPWYRTGVQNFLLERGAAGLEECITWLRKH